LSETEEMTDEVVDCKECPEWDDRLGLCRCPQAERTCGVRKPLPHRAETEYEII
jgi:hypothetical protein